MAKGENLEGQCVRVKMGKEKMELVRHVSYERGNIILSRGEGRLFCFAYSVSSAS